MTKDTIINGDALDVLKTLPDQSVHCVVTSPPYWGLRDYGVAGQMGLEKSPEDFIEKMVILFRDVRRVLKDDGTLWLNIGDTYAGRGGYSANSPSNAHSKTGKYFANSGASTKGRKPSGRIKAKDLVGIPWMIAFALRADGWYLRQDIIWSKPNAMPESVTDRCTKCHEYIFLLSKSHKYHFDSKSIRTAPAESSIQRWNQDIERQAGSDRVPGKTNGKMKAVGGTAAITKKRGHRVPHAGFIDKWDQMTVPEQVAMGANRRSVWNIATASFSEAHFATFPEELPRLCISAGCPAGGISC